MIKKQLNDKTMKIIVGSSNPVKIKCVRKIFAKYFEKISVEGKKVESKVGRQPESEEETIKGARNRAKGIHTTDNPDFALGIEGGLEHIRKKYYAYAWICIRSKDRKESMGRTASYPLSFRMIDIIKKGKELGEANDIVFKTKKSKIGKGAIGSLSKGYLDRSGLLEQGVICALLPFINKDLYD